ncbi:CrcB family protein [Myxococcota bacterium]|nr:CrcB family protein [Myxococcota bacterium]
MNSLAWTFSIVLGAAGGALLRHASYLWIEARGHGSFPLPTFFVNLVGSFLIGLVVSLGSAGVLDRFWVELLAGGGCGAFTTFSSFSADWMRLNRTGHFGLGAAYVALTLGVGMALAALGLLLGGILR